MLLVEWSRFLIVKERAVLRIPVRDMLDNTPQIKHILQIKADLE